LALLAALAAPAAADPLSPAAQADNMALSLTRAQALTPDLLLQAAAVAGQRDAARAQIHQTDPERNPDPNFCSSQACVGDPRLEHFPGIVKPVLFTARDGATLSGHVWATRRGPGVVVINGSILAPEDYYWPFAQALARAGYVVLSFDAQGEGVSDQLGEAPDEHESQLAGVPPIGDGGPFYDGGEDALDFLLSTKAHPYVPVPSRTTHTSHAAKQQRRVQAGLDTAYNPLFRLLDRHAKVGLAGHSYGAEAASYLGQYDPRVGAVAAWDSLCLPVQANRTERDVLGSPGPTVLGIPFPTAASSLPPTCFGAPDGYPGTVPLRTPAIGMSGDYVAPRPFTEAPQRDYKAQVVDAFARASVDSANVVVRGANHADFSFLPAPLGTLRGIDMTTWYTVAWFDRYLRHDPTADARLLTDRWRHDARGQAADPGGDGNLFSELYDSRLKVRGLAECADLRVCAALRAGPDCAPADWGYVAVDTGAEPVARRRCAAVPMHAARVVGRAAGQQLHHLGEPGRSDARTGAAPGVCAFPGPGCGLSLPVSGTQRPHLGRARRGLFA
jgi:dienelactone hydrolase